MFPLQKMPHGSLENNLDFVYWPTCARPVKPLKSIVWPECQWRSKSVPVGTLWFDVVLPEVQSGEVRNKSVAR